MRLFPSLLLFGFSLFVLPLQGQEKPTEQQRPFIEVQGTAEMKVVPDEIFVYVNLKERVENREKITVAVQEEKLLSALKSININLDEVSLASANSDYVRIKRNTKEVLTQKTYLVIVKDAKSISDLFDQLDRLEIEDAGISKLSHSKMDSLTKENNKTAIRDAKDKAGYMLSAIGETLDVPLIIFQSETDIWNSTEITVHGSKSSNKNNVIEGVRIYGGKPTADEISFQKIIIRSNVLARFAIQ